MADADTTVDAIDPAAPPAREPAGLSAWWRSIDRSAWTTAGVLAVAFVVSRIAYQAAGVTFDSSFLPLAQQHLELAHLEDHLLQSLWYQHTQPPLFNLLLGLLLKVSPFSLAASMHGLYLVLGAVLLGLLYVLLRDLRVSRWWSVGLAVVVCCGPTIVVYEHWPSYEYPLAVMVTGLAVAALRWARTGGVRWLAIAVGLGAACTLTRVLFNPLWFAGLVVLLVVARRPARSRWHAAGVVVAVPVLIIVGLMAKNLVLFDTPLFSSWGGWNLQRVTVDELPDGRLEELIADGTVTPMARIPVQLALENYAGETEPCVPAHPDVPVLSEPRKSNGWENFNHECYLPITREALDNAIAAGLAEPKNTVRVWVASFQIWAAPSSLYAFVYDNRAAIQTADTWYRQVVLLDVPWSPPVQTDAAWYLPLGTPGGRWRASLSIVLGTLLAVGLGGRSAWRIVRGRGRPRDAQLAVIGFTVLTVTLTGNLLEIGENNRFRFVVEPVTLAIFFASLCELGRITRRKPARIGAPVRLILELGRITRRKPARSKPQFGGGREEGDGGRWAARTGPRSCHRVREIIGDMHSDIPLSRFAARQHGLILRSQAHASGLSRAAIARRVNRGRLEEVTPSILAVAGAPETPLQRAMAAVLQAGHGGCLAFDSAGALFGLPGYELEPLHVWRLRDQTRRENPLGIQHKTRRMPAHHIQRLQGIRTVTPTRLLADEAARLPLAQLARLVDDTWGRGLTGYRALTAMTDELRRRGRKGIPLLRDLTEERGPAYRPPASRLERRVMRLLLDQGFGRFERQIDVEGPQGWIGRVDFRHETYPLVLEVQSELFHAGLTDRRRDRGRIRALRDSGLVVVELWEFEIWHRPDDVLALVQQGIDEARRLPTRRAA